MTLRLKSGSRVGDIRPTIAQIRRGAITKAGQNTIRQLASTIPVDTGELKETFLSYFRRKIATMASTGSTNLNLSDLQLSSEGEDEFFHSGNIENLDQWANTFINEYEIALQVEARKYGVDIR